MERLNVKTLRRRFRRKYPKRTILYRLGVLFAILFAFSVVILCYNTLVARRMQAADSALAVSVCMGDILRGYIDQQSIKDISGGRVEATLSQVLSWYGAMPTGQERIIFKGSNEVSIRGSDVRQKSYMLCYAPQAEGLMLYKDDIALSTNLEAIEADIILR